MKVIGYTRYSSLEQGKGSSVVRQRELITNFANRQGWSIDDWVGDEGRSAWTGDNLVNGNLGKLVRLLEAEGASQTVIVVEKLDRLSRQPPLVMAGWLQKVCATGARIVTADGRHSITADDLLRNQIQVLTIIFEAFRGFDESQVKSARVAEAWRQKRVKAAPMTARCPGWLRLRSDRSGFEIIEDRARVVRRIFDDTERGIGKYTIASALNAEKIPTFGRGNGWHASYVQKIVRNPAVLGDFQPHRKAKADIRRTPDGDVIQGYFPAVIGEEQFARVNDRRANAVLVQQGSGRRLTNLFTGLGKCASCGGSMTYRNKGPAVRADGSVVSETYLACDNAIRARGCANKVHFNYAGLEAGVLNHLLHLALDDQVFAERDSISELSGELAGVKRSLEGVEKRIANVWTLIEEDADDDHARERYRRLKAERLAAQTRLDQLEEALAEAKGKVPASVRLRRVQEIRELLGSTDDEQRYQARRTVKLALNDLIDRMQFDGVAERVMLRIASGLRLLVLDRRGNEILDADLYKRGRSIERADATEQAIVDAYLQRLSASEQAAV